MANRFFVFWVSSNPSTKVKQESIPIISSRWYALFSGHLSQLLRQIFVLLASGEPFSHFCMVLQIRVLKFIFNRHFAFSMYLKNFVNGLWCNFPFLFGLSVIWH